MAFLKIVTLLEKHFAKSFLILNKKPNLKFVFNNDETVNKVTVPLIPFLNKGGLIDCGFYYAIVT